MKRRVHVVMGGPSAEYEVSIRSGREVVANLNRDSYDVTAVVISHDRKFYRGRLSAEVPSFESLAEPAKSRLFSGPCEAADSKSVWQDCDVAFLALHGSFGEDGVFQGFLDTLGVPYTGSGVFASATAMNKIATKFMYIQNGLDVPVWSLFGENHPGSTVESLARKHSFPCFVKCPQSGSSRLMGRAGNQHELASMLSELSRHAPELLIESAVSGVEFSCGVLEYPDGRVAALPPVEIRPVTASFFDYEAKYTDGGSEEIVPAPHPPELLAKVENVALAAHRMIGCRGVSRTDMILSDGRLHVLETNTLPGLTPNSLLPRAFRAQGGTYPGLLDTLIATALHKSPPA